MMKQMLTVATMIAMLGSFGCSKGDDRAVVARVGQTKITVGDYKRQLEGLENFQMEQAVATDDAARKEFLEDLIGIELVLQEAKRQGLDKDAEYKKTMEAIKKEYDETKQRLEKRYREAGRNELFKIVLKKELADRAAKLEPPTDKEISDFYVKNREKMISMDGKRIPLKDVAPQIKNRLMQERQRDLYLAYIKGLREKANVKVDEKVLDAMASALSVTATLQVPQLSPETGKQAQPAEGGAAKTK